MTETDKNIEIIDIPMVHDEDSNEFESEEVINEIDCTDYDGNTNNTNDDEFRFKMIANNSKANDGVEFILENYNFDNICYNKSKITRLNKEKIEKHKCQVCYKHFLKRSNLIDHLRLHADIKLYKCDYCDKSFVQMINYKTHLRTHTKERPYKCHICEKSFNQSTPLKIHIRYHTNERTYKCDVCNKSFTNGSCLSKHKLIHYPQLQHKCYICKDKRFAQKANLRRHLIQKHQTELQIESK